MKNHIYTAILFSSLMYIIGCDALLVSNDTSAKVIRHETIPLTRDGRLMFESKSDFHAYTEHLIRNQDPSYLDKVEAGLNDFVSLRTATNQLIVQEGMDDGNQNNLRMVEDIVLESVLNDHGEIQIADSVYKITHNYIYMVDHQESDLLSSIYLRSSVSSKLPHHSSVHVREVDRSVTSGALQKTSSATAIQSPSECWGNFPVSEGENRKYRMKGSYGSLIGGYTARLVLNSNLNKFVKRACLEDGFIRRQNSSKFLGHSR